MNNKTETTHEVKRTYKDSVFVTIFHDKAKLIELYNALFDTNYDESAPIDIVTIKDVLFRTLKNEEDALQLIVKVYNINTEKNSEILKKCETLRQYSRFVEIMRSYKEDSELTNDVIVEVLDKCRKEGILTEFLDKYGTEIVEMLFKELTREEDLEISRLDGYEEGFTRGEHAGFSKGERAGAERGAKQEKIGIAKKLKQLGLSVDSISESTGLTLEEIAEL
jgi:predicted transposase/invertase (TIGR01784 family)